MNKIKIIDLLYKIANGEKYPKIKFNNNVYKYHDKEHGYCRHYYDNTYICLNSEYHFFDILNDEVEIIEEEKKLPEKLGLIKYCEDQATSLIHHKVDEIIDYLDYLESKEEGDE